MRLKQALAVLAATTVAQASVLLVVFGGIAAANPSSEAIHPWKILLFSGGCGLVSAVVLILPPFLLLAAKRRLTLGTALLVGVAEAILLTVIDIVLSPGFIGLVLALGMALPTLLWGLVGGVAAWLAWQALEQPVKLRTP